MGIEPTSSAWKAEVLPLNYTRLHLNPYRIMTPYIGMIQNPFVPRRLRLYFRLLLAYKNPDSLYRLNCLDIITHVCVVALLAHD